MPITINDLEIGDLVIGVKEGVSHSGVVVGQGAAKRMLWFSSEYCSLPTWDGVFRDYAPLDIYKKKDINLLAILHMELKSWLT